MSLSERYHLNVMSWQTEHYLDGTFRSTKMLKMDFKELPPWFTMAHVGEQNKVEATPQMLSYLNFGENSFSVKEDLISIMFAEKSKTQEMMDIAKQCCTDCGEDCCDCSEEDDDEEEEEESELKIL